MPARLTLQTFLPKAQKVHGDKFTYHKLEFEGGASVIYASCPEHGPFSQKTVKHLNSQGCVACGKAQIGKSLRLSEAEILQKCRAVHGETYIYKGVEYKKGRAYLDIECKKHGSFQQDMREHTSGKGCKLCGYESSAVKRRAPVESLITRASKAHGSKYTYVGVNYDKRDPEIEAICSEHGLFKQSAGHHISGGNCPACAAADRGIDKRYTIEEIKAKSLLVHSTTYNYKDLEAGAGNKTRVTVICSKHGETRQRVEVHLRGNGCPKCGKAISKPSKEIVELLESWSLGVVSETVIPTSQKRMDIYIPNLKLGIEYNGNYWHSSKYTKSNTHKERSELAAAQGIRLIHIFSHEWLYRRSAVEVLLRRVTSTETNKVAARKCKITHPTKELANAFLELNHIQGKVHSGEFVGLEYDSKLIAVMAFNFNTSNRGDSVNFSKVELTRYASSCTVVGGFSKLLRAWLKENCVKTVVSYSDNRLFTGKVYELAGFKKMHTTQPDYRYLEPGWDDTLHHKAKYQKKHLVERFGVEACEGKTERQITEENGIYQVYDCGKTLWELTVEDTVSQT